MPLIDELPRGASAFLDSTILHYAFVSYEPATQKCLALLKRVESGEIRASITVPVLNDAIHKVMCSEAVARFARPRAGIVRWLKDHPEITQQLTAANEVLVLVKQLNVELLPIGFDTLARAQGVVAEHGLLASDALILAVMQEHGLSSLATNDDDFDALEGLAVWKPR